MVEQDIELSEKEIKNFEKEIANIEEIYGELVQTESVGRQNVKQTKYFLTSLSKS